MKLGDKKYTPHIKNDHEIVLNNNAEVVHVEDTGDIKKLRLQPVQIARLNGNLDRRWFCAELNYA